MGRVPYWNISYGIVIDLLAAPVLAIFLYGWYGYWKLIKQGKSEIVLGSRLRSSALKIGPVYISGLLQRGIAGSRIYKKPFTGIAHGLLFWGMGLLFGGTVAVFMYILFDLPVFIGAFNRWFMAFALDAAGLAAFAGVMFLLIRRLVFPAERLLVPKPRPGFVFLEVVIGVIVLTGFLLEALRISQRGVEEGAFVGNWVASLLGGGADGLMVHQIVWWLHGFVALAFIAYIPYSPLSHLVLAPINAGLADPEPGPNMGVLDFSAFEDDEADEAPTLGAATLTDFSRKSLLEFSSCLWCGRCHEVCPAAQTGKSLSPKGVIVTLSEHMCEDKFKDGSLLDTISSAAIYSCTTCAACMEACPVSVNQPKAIMRMRQHLLMERSEIPDTMGQAHRSLEARQHPFFGSGCGPNDWRKDIDVPIFEEGKTDYLLWVGCATAYEDRAQKVARAMVNILQKAGVSFGVLEEGRCTGDPAKQMGNELLFTEIAQQNIDEFTSLHVKNIITMCPHCYDSFTRHYPPLGGLYSVISHSVFINSLIESGKLKLKHGEQSICYHDPCYLGRHNAIFNEPRSVVSSVGQLVEMPKNRENSFCCGGGGGNYWAEEEGTRIIETRAKEAFDTGAVRIATACPFCLLMFTDGLKKHTDESKVYDIAELVSLAMTEVAGFPWTASPGS